MLISQATVEVNTSLQRRQQRFWILLLQVLPFAWFSAFLFSQCGLSGVEPRYLHVSAFAEFLNIYILDQSLTKSPNSCFSASQWEKPQFFTDFFKRLLTIINSFFFKRHETIPVFVPNIIETCCWYQIPKRQIFIMNQFLSFGVLDVLIFIFKLYI